MKNIIVNHVIGILSDRSNVTQQDVEDFIELGVELAETTGHAACSDEEFGEMVAEVLESI